ncbi:MAG: ABC transporter ATP-binding protein [Crocinitomicaceae bacterium]|nr:ABC transporter ATP-binding protein [Crocinitomicaceae bacterium]
MENHLDSIAISNLSIHYKKQQVLKDVNLRLQKGGIHVLVGPNGSGKTSLLNALSGEISYSGSILLEGKEQQKLSKNELAQTLSMVHSTNAVHHIQVEEFIRLARFPYTNFLGRLSETDKEIIHKGIQLVGIEELLSKSVDELSDGERKKVMIAAALAQDCPIMLMDEPTTFLDIGNKFLFSKLLQQMKLELGKTLVISTHDLDLVFQVADSVLLIQDQHIEQHSVQEVRDQKLIEKTFEAYHLQLDANGKLIL